MLSSRDPILLSHACVSIAMQSFGPQENIRELRRKDLDREGSGPRNRWDRERVIQSAKEAIKKATETLRRLSGKEKIEIEEDQREIEKDVDKLAKETVKIEEEENKTEDPSFAKEEPEEEFKRSKIPKEDLSMFERDLVLPEEGAMRVDCNLQAAKYMVLHLLRRIHRRFNTWWKFNVAISREKKLEITGGDYPIKEINPTTGEPELCTPYEFLERPRNRFKHKRQIVDGEHLVTTAYPMHVLIHMP